MQPPAAKIARNRFVHVRATAMIVVSRVIGYGSRGRHGTPWLHGLSSDSACTSLTDPRKPFTILYLVVDNR